MMLRELGAKLDLERVHFLGMIDYVDYLRLLQVSSAHVYLTYPFVLSWSFIEAMASGCLIVASATPPVLEVLRDGENGFAVDCQPSLAAR
jgi:glycosyltransferase involved in cell wall biosynthesis